MHQKPIFLEEANTRGKGHTPSLLKSSTKESDFFGQRPSLTCVPAAAVQGSVVVLYSKADRCSGLLTEGRASARAENDISMTVHYRLGCSHQTVPLPRG